MKTVKEKLDDRYYLNYILETLSEEMVKRRILIDLKHELNSDISDESAIYAMFIWGEVVKQYLRYNKS